MKRVLGRKVGGVFHSNNVRCAPQLTNGKLFNVLLRKVKIRVRAYKRRENYGGEEGCRDLS